MDIWLITVIRLFVPVYIAGPDCRYSPSAVKKEDEDSEDEIVVVGDEDEEEEEDESKLPWFNCYVDEEGDRMVLEVINTCPSSSSSITSIVSTTNVAASKPHKSSAKDTLRPTLAFSGRLKFYPFLSVPNFAVHCWHVFQSSPGFKDLCFVFNASPALEFIDEHFDTNMFLIF